MARIDRYLLSQLTVLFGFFSLVLVSVYWVNRAVILFDQLIADGQSASTFLTFTLLTLPNVIRLVLPVSAFVAAVYVTNRMITESELVVAQSTGLSPWRLARPFAMFGLLTALLMAVLVHVLVPASRIGLAERSAEIDANISARLLIEGQFLHPSDGVTFYIREISADGTLEDVFLSDSRSATSRTTFTAQRGFLVREDTGPKLVMFEGTSLNLEMGTGQLQTTLFEDFTYDIGALVRDPGARVRDVREFDTLTLFSPDDMDIAITGKSRAEFTYEAHLRLVQPFMPLVAALIGFAALLLGDFSRFGLWRQVGLAIALLIAVQLCESSAADIARQDPGLWPVVYGAPMLGLVFAVALLWWAGRPRRRRKPHVAEAQPA